MLNIVSIGGGDLRTGETEPIDREIVRLAGKERPRALFVPTASDDNEEYAQAFTDVYGKLGCEIDVLRLWTDAEVPSATERVRQADLIYVGGGNTKKMLARWRKTGVEVAMREAATQGKPLGGLSAGAICWARLANSDWPQYEGIEGVNTAPLEGMSLLPLALCPHTSRETFRLGEFRAMMRGVPLVGLGLDDGCALQVRGEQYRLLGCLPGAVAHRIEWRADDLMEEELVPHADYRPLKDLTRRR